MTLSVLIGYLAIFFGLLWAIWPQLLRGWAVGRLSWVLFWALFFSLLYPLASQAAEEWGANIWVAAVVIIVLVGSLLRALLSKAASKLPLVIFRVAALLILGAGIWQVLRGG